MQKSSALGIFIVFMAIGAATIIMDSQSELFLFSGMILIAIGTLNLAYVTIFEKPIKPVTLKVVRKRKKSIRNKSKTSKKIKR